jgi:hypothetical protein
MANNILTSFAENPALMGAVRDVLLKHLSIDGLSQDVSDELLGQAVRARLVGTRAVEDAFREIESYKVIPNIGKNENPGY